MKAHVLCIERRSILIFFYACVLLSACADKTDTFLLTIQRFQDKKLVSIHVETACTPQEQQRGFMGRESIPDGTGMLFVYKKDSNLEFWMKNTPHPLSIAFIDFKGRIREIKDMQPYSLTVVSSTYAVRYALEVPQGYFERAKIMVGDSLTDETLELLQKKI